MAAVFASFAVNVIVIFPFLSGKTFTLFAPEITFSMPFIVNNFTPAGMSTRTVLFLLEPAKVADNARTSDVSLC